MSTGNLAPLTPAIKDFQKVWSESITQVLGQIAGVPVTALVMPIEGLGEQFQKLDTEGVWIRFTAGKRLAGEHAFLLSKADGLRLVQLFMGEEPAEDATFNDDYRDALVELFRQFAGQAVTVLKSKLGGEVEFQFAGATKPEWEPAMLAGFQLVCPKIPPVLVGLLGNAELVKALEPAPSEESKEAPATPPEPSASSPSGQQQASVPAAQTPVTQTQKENIDLLMDVELEVTLRFGEREMLLRDVLELNAGAVVELDRQIQEPAELLVAGKLVARGEVVIVDGYYGLRITEIVSTSRRLEALAR